MIIDIKTATLAKHPFLYAFFNGAYLERDEETASAIQSLLSRQNGIQDQYTLEGIELSKFKEGIDPKLVMRILVRMAEGMVSEQPNRTIRDLGEFYREFNECVDLFRRNFYKEECLTQN